MKFKQYLKCITENVDTNYKLKSDRIERDLRTINLLYNANINKYLSDKIKKGKIDNINKIFNGLENIKNFVNYSLANLFDKSRDIKVKNNNDIESINKLIKIINDKLKKLNTLWKKTDIDNKKYIKTDQDSVFFAKEINDFHQSLGNLHNTILNFAKQI